MSNSYDLWNEFINKGTEDIERFNDLSDVEKDAIIIYELYSQSASGDGWEYFFDHMKYYKIPTDFVNNVIHKYFNEELSENFSNAKHLYETEGFDGDYDEVNKPLFDFEAFIENLIYNFINKNSDLYS